MIRRLDRAFANKFGVALARYHGLLTQLVYMAVWA
jgi:hypothetical protein